MTYREIVLPMTHSYNTYVLVRPQTPNLSGVPGSAATYTEMTLTCDSPSPAGNDTSYVFYLDGDQVQEGKRNTYNIDSVAMTDAGDYTCVVTNQGLESSPSSARNLDVVGK